MLGIPVVHTSVYTIVRVSVSVENVPVAAPVVVGDDEAAIAGAGAGSAAGSAGGSAGRANEYTVRSTPGGAARRKAWKRGVMPVRLLATRPPHVWVGSPGQGVLQRSAGRVDGEDEAVELNEGEGPPKLLAQ